MSIIDKISLFYYNIVILLTLINANKLFYMKKEASCKVNI